jgi:hypothetical protein
MQLALQLLLLVVILDEHFGSGDGDRVVHGLRGVVRRVL